VPCHSHDRSPIKFVSCSEALLNALQPRRISDGRISDGPQLSRSGIAHIHTREFPWSTAPLRQSVVYVRLPITTRARNRCQESGCLSIVIQLSATLRCRVIAYLSLLLLAREQYESDLMFVKEWATENCETRANRYVGDLPLPGKMFRARIHKQPVTFETNQRPRPVLLRRARFRFVSSIYLSVADSLPRSHPLLEPDRFHDGILIRLADGTSISYGPKVLYEHRGAGGNREVADDAGAP
jgi:hypothetical protein